MKMKIKIHNQMPCITENLYLTLPNITGIKR